VNRDDLSPDLRALLDTVPDAPVTTADVVYDEGGTALEGFLAGPTDASGTDAPATGAGAGGLPAALLVHDWYGVVDHVRVRAEMLARLGVVALAADVYGQGVRPGPDEAADAAGRFYGDVDLFRARLAAGLERLRAEPGVDPARVVVMGWCFGGSGALELARAGADVAGVVSFHGGLGTSAPAEKGAVRAPVLVLTGAADPIVPDEAVAAFQDEMRDAGAPDWQVVTYSDAMHAFAVPGTDAPDHGARYQAVADRRSWAAMTAFVDEVAGLPRR